ncbi:MAG: hypothetical protein LQ350_007805 [Teloschistes chrysophthalmus]|nr:MAG: hypothetical protein LQ350_007805 [Niorma chrysophthalma]
MADPLYELLTPYIDSSSSSRPTSTSGDGVTNKYLERLHTLSLSSLTSQEPQSLAQSSHSTLLSIQSLSSRSNAAIIASSDHFANLKNVLPLLAEEASRLRTEIPKMDERAATFSTAYSRSTENEVLDRRKRALLMERNADRLSDVLDLPNLLSSAISSSAAQGASSTASYAAALDLFSHIKRLHLLYADSPLISSIYAQTESAMHDLTSHLIAALKSQSIKLASGMRTVGWLRRVAPELDTGVNGTGSHEGLLGYLFLLCRLSTLVTTLSALEPLKQLADAETDTRLRKTPKPTTSKGSNGSAWHGGQQSERYLKRYIEIFREQSFAIISTYKSIFPSSADAQTTEGFKLPFKSAGLKSLPSLTSQASQKEKAENMPSALSTFPPYLADLLFDTLREYLPNVLDKTSKESLFTQVLYCAGSLGRLGGDFSLMLPMLSSGLKEESDESEDDDESWVEVMRKHRELAGRLEALASGVGSSKGADKGGSVRIKS